MKHRITAITLALGLAGISGVSTAQDQDQAQNQKPTVEMRNIIVTAEPAPYEAYDTYLHAGFTFHTLVGHTRQQYLSAQREADRLESLRKQGMAMQPWVSVAVDNSAGAGLATQFQLLDGSYNTIAIVNVYCKRMVPAGSARCRLVPQRMAGEAGQRVGVIQAAAQQVAAADPRN